MLTDGVSAEVSWNPREIESRMACNASRGEHFGNAEQGDWMSCAEICQNADGCSFFHYDPNDGECFAVNAADASCPSGFTTSNWYNFYGI